MTDRILRKAEVTYLVGYCDIHLARLEKAGKFPARFKLNPESGQQGAVGWHESEVQAWIASRKPSQDVPTFRTVLKPKAYDEEYARKLAQS